MINKFDVIKKLKKLEELTKARESNQGIAIYESAQKQIANANSAEELTNIDIKLSHALSGIEAHGTFTEDEYNLVKEIRKLLKS